MSKIEVGRYSELLRRMFGMAGQQTVAGELSPEVSPTIQLEGESADWDFLKGVRNCSGSSDVAAAVGFTSRWRLRNPVGSGVIAVVRYLSFSVHDIANVKVARSQVTADHPLQILAVVPDTRWSAGLGQTTLILSVDNASVATVAGSVIADNRLGAEQEFVYPVEVVIMPGSCFEYGTSNFNVAAKAFCNWVERQLPAMEV